MIPSHAFSQDAAVSNPLPNRSNQPAPSHQPASHQQPSSNQRTKSPRASQLLQTLENLFVPPKGGAPQSTANSATRHPGKCNANEAAIQAITPPLGYGLSASDRPAITLDLPPTSAQQVALLFRSESGLVEHQAWLPIAQPPAQPSGQQSQIDERSKHWTSFQLPESSPGILPGQSYRWSLVVVCGETIEPDDPTFMGWVEYRAPTAAEQMVLTELSGKDKLGWLGEQGYWYDMLLN